MENQTQETVVEKAINPETVQVKAIKGMKLSCTVCKGLKGTNSVQLKKQIEKSGLAKDEYVAAYKCRKCRKG